MLSLPIELLRPILRYATFTDGALDTGFSITAPDDYYEISRRISASMITKRNLSLVSKLFHALTDEYLFEIVRLKDYRLIRPLVDLLRQDIPGRPKRGWWCRRLELDLRYEGYSWIWGTFTLWGLIPACPRLVDLRCHIEYLNTTFSTRGSANLHARFPVSNTMLKLIASDLAPTLRRLELTGQVTVPFDEVECLLLHLDKLESCRILGLQVPGPSNFDFDNNPKFQRDPLKECEDAGERMEYDSARHAAAWPATPTTPTTASWAILPHLPHLPHLHTLDVAPFTAAIAKWHLPSLVAVGAGLYQNRTPVERADQVNMGIIDRAVNIRSLTCYGVRGQGIDIWSLVGSLPNIEYLQYHIPWTDLDSRLSVPLKKLGAVTMYRNFYNNAGHKRLLQNLYDYRQNGLLPALKQISVTGTEVPRSHMAPVLVQELEAAGVSVESNTTEGLWLIDLV